MEWQEWCFILLVLLQVVVFVWIYAVERNIRKEEANRKPIGWDVYKSQIFM